MEENKLITEDFWGETLTDISIEYYNDTSFFEIKEIKRICLGFCNKSINISTINDTDEIKVELYDSPTLSTELKKENMLIRYIGKKLGMTWECINLRGYSDMYIIAFEYLHPNILILCESSSLLLFEVQPTNLHK